MAKKDLLELDGIVDEVLPDSRYRVTLDNGVVDPTKGRINFRHKASMRSGTPLSGFAAMQRRTATVMKLPMDPRTMLLARLPNRPHSRAMFFNIWRQPKSTQPTDARFGCAHIHLRCRRSTEQPMQVFVVPDMASCITRWSCAIVICPEIWSRRQTGGLTQRRLIRKWRAEVASEGSEYIDRL